VIHDQQSAIRWLLHSARFARQHGLDAAQWWGRMDMHIQALVLFFVTPRQVHAVREIVWSKRSLV
jgi:hypothetical protein